MSDFNQLLENLEKMTDRIIESVEKQMLVETKRIQADAKGLVVVVSGQLRNSITTDVSRSAERDIIGTVGTNIAHGMIVEFGSGPVGAASEKVLPPGVNIRYRSTGWAFKNTKTGKFAYTKGQPARPFLYPAFKHNQNIVKENIANAVKNAVKEV